MSEKGFQHFIGQLLLSVLIPVLVILAFYLGIGNVYTESVSHAENVLKNALEENITECYAEEGRYPESLSYLEKNYGLRYDHDLFYIDYKVRGENIRPEITVLRKDGGQD